MIEEVNAFERFTERVHYVRIDPSIRYWKHMVRPFRTSDAPYDAEREPHVIETRGRLRGDQRVQPPNP